MNTREVKVWGCRIDTRDDRRKFIWDCLQGEKFLRQGWGYDISHDLRSAPQPADKNVRRNYSIFNKVKKGDYVLVPRLPNWNSVTILRASENWNDDGYKFEISKKFGDYGHKFPAEIVRSFNRSHQLVKRPLRTKLGFRQRFCELRGCIDNVRELEQAEEVESASSASKKLSDILTGALQSNIDLGVIVDSAHRQLCATMHNKDWEKVIEQYIKELYPDFITEVVQGITESKHGTDILVKVPMVFGADFYGIAIQVKDYGGEVSEKDYRDAVQQINKSDNYWIQNSDVGAIVEKIVIFTRAKQDQHIGLTTLDDSVSIYFEEDVKMLLTQLYNRRLGLD